MAAKAEKMETKKVDSDFETVTAGGEFIKFEKHGDMFNGWATSLSQVDTRFGTQMLLNVIDHDGVGFSIPLSADLKRKIESLHTSGLLLGAYLKIEYVDDDDTGKGSPMKVFDVKRKKQAPPLPVAKA